MGADFELPGVWPALAVWAVAAVVLVVAGAFVPIFRGAGARGRGGAGSWAAFASARRHLVTRSERDFEQVLRKVLEEAGLGAWGVHVQVAMSAVLEGKRRPPGPGQPRGPWVPPWVLDFVLTDGSGAIRGIVELNDPTHRRWDRKRRDNNLEAGCRRLGMPLLFVTREGRDKLARWVARLG